MSDDVNTLAAEIKSNFDKKLNEVKEIAEKALASSNAFTSSEKEKADIALTELNEAKSRLDEIEQKMTRSIAREEHIKSLGEQYTESDGFKEMSVSPQMKSSYSMSVKADITGSTTDSAGSAGAAIAPNRLAGVQSLPQQRLTIRDLLTPGSTDSPLISFIQETGFTNNAKPVAEGNLKPQSDIKLTEKDISTIVIAHWFRASKQILSDFSQLRSMIDERLIYGLKLVEERQLLNGDGTSGNLNGLITQASAFVTPNGLKTPTPTTSIDTLRIAMLQAALAEYPATSHVLNDIDWAGIEMLKDSEGRYIIGNPQGNLSPTLWGLPVVTTQAISAGKFLTGAFKMGAQVFDQWASRIEVGFQNDDFTTNKVTILAEERLALAVYRPEAFVYGSINPATSA